MPTLLEAIEAKYSESDDNGTQDGSFVIFAPRTCARDCLPSILVLDNRNVDCAGDEKQLAKLCSNVQELDLSHNKLTNWTDVAIILKHTPTATFLNLGFNQLSSPLENSLLSSLPYLKSLVLIGTNVSWDTVWTLLKFTSNLMELHLSKNSYDYVNSPNNDGENISFQCVTKLMFDGNPISNWTEIAKLGKMFPELKQLSLSNCPIRSIPEQAFDQFGKLETINVCSTLLQIRDDIIELNKFPVLTEIRTTGIPFLDELPENERRQELVALLPKIRKLNGGAIITDDERDGAERHFIRKYMDEVDKPLRYFELVEKHGVLEPLVDIELKPITEATLRIQFGKMEVDQKVNLYQSVRSLKKSLEPLVGIEPARMVLYYNDFDANGGCDVLRFPNKQLYTYNMVDGDVIHVELKNKTSHEITK